MIPMIRQSGKSQYRGKTMGFGAWHTQFQNLALSFIIDVTLGKLLNNESEFSNPQGLDTSYAKGCGKVQYV